MKGRLVSSGRLTVVDFGVSVWECAGWLGRGVVGVLGLCPGLVAGLPGEGRLGQAPWRVVVRDRRRLGA